MPTEFLEIPADGAPPQRDVERAVECLRRGELVALPTETVYGLAARADLASALELLADVKGHSKDRALTWHVAEASPALEVLPELAGLVHRLVDRYWPGPLTLVLHGVPEGLAAVARDGWTGVRQPAHEGTRAVLAAADFPIVMSSANLRGETPPADAAAVRAIFDERVALILDGGPAQLASSSTVLAVGRGRFELLRKGFLELEQLRSTAGLELMFVCTGNTCRSPMAEALARSLLAQRLGTDDLTEFGFHVSSAGVMAGPGAPAAQNAVAMMAEFGASLEDRRVRGQPRGPSFQGRELFRRGRGGPRVLLDGRPPGRAHRALAAGRCGPRGVARPGRPRPAGSHRRRSRDLPPERRRDSGGSEGATR